MNSRRQLGRPSPASSKFEQPSEDFTGNTQIRRTRKTFRFLELKRKFLFGLQEHAIIKLIENFLLQYAMRGKRLPCLLTYVSHFKQYSFIFVTIMGYSLCSNFHPRSLFLPYACAQRVRPLLCNLTSWPLWPFPDLLWFTTANLIASYTQNQNARHSYFPMEAVA